MTRKYRVLSCIVIICACLIATPAFSAETKTAAAPAKKVEPAKSAAQGQKTTQVASVSPAKAQPKAAAKPAASKGSAKPASKAQPKGAAKTVGKPKAEEEDQAAIQRGLDEFAKTAALSMNKNLRPSEKFKQVEKCPEGYRASYLAVDTASMNTSYNAPESSKTVSYVGRMVYHEVEYVCIAPTKEDALKGPFVENKREKVTELIKYMKGKWTY